ENATASRNGARGENASEEQHRSRWPSQGGRLTELRALPHTVYLRQPVAPGQGSVSSSRGCKLSAPAEYGRRCSAGQGQPPNDGLHRLDIGRFREVLVKTRFQSSRAILRAPEPRERGQRDAAQECICSHAARELVAAHP